MRKLILASHGSLAMGMLNSIEMIVGKSECEIETFCLEPGHLASDFAIELEKEIKSNLEKEFVIITDLYGASVASGLAPLSEYDNVIVFTGMCSNLVLNLLVTYKDKLEANQLEELLNEARIGIQVIDLKKISDEMEEF